LVILVLEAWEDNLDENSLPASSIEFNVYLLYFISFGFISKKHSIGLSDDLLFFKVLDDSIIV
jgi:hypothetical protein